MLQTYFLVFGCNNVILNYSTKFGFWARGAQKGRNKHSPGAQGSHLLRCFLVLLPKIRGPLHNSFLHI